MPTSTDNTIMKAIFGDDDTEVVKAGTLAVTRGAGVVGAAFTAAANLTPLGDPMTTDQKLWLSVAVGFGWVLLAAADALARGYATAHAARHVTTPLNPPVRVSVPSRRHNDEDGWAAYLMQSNGNDDVRYFVVKNGEANWISQQELRFGAKR